MLQFLIKKYFWLILVLIFLLLRLPSLFEPYWYGDEGIYLTIGQALNHGWQLYQQIHDNKPPTLYLLAALAPTVTLFRLLLLLWMIPTIFVFYKLASRFFKPPLAQLSVLLFTVLTSIPVIEGNIANAEIFMLLPTILGMFIALAKPVTNYRLLITGLLLGFAFTFKVPVVADFAFLFLWLLVIQKIKKPSLFIINYSLLILGFLLPIFLYGLYYLFTGSFSYFLNAALLQNFGYLSSWSHSSQPGSGLLLRAIIAGLIYLVLFGLYLLKKISREFLFLTAWFVAALFGALLSGRPYPHYLLEAVPALILLLVYFFKHRFLLIPALFILFIAALLKYQFYFYAVIPYYTNFYSYIINHKSKSDYRSYFGSKVNSLYEISDYIDAHTIPSDRIFVWGDVSMIYPLSQRLPTGRYTAAYHIADFNGYRETMVQLQTYLPPVVVYYPQPSRPFPALDTFLANYYYPDKVIDSALIYRLRV